MKPDPKALSEIDGSSQQRGEILTRDTDALWFKDAVIYELHVRSFADSDGDGIGDFKGLTCKLDYLRDLGVTALWILPFYPSPLRDDGYDIADYRTVNPSYGTVRDFKTFLREAQKRGLRVITELVINHTSDQHAWFQRARRAKAGSIHRDFYVWSDDPRKYAETRIIFKDFETSNWSWDPVAGAYYWHRFFHHQPDLNFDSPHVRREVLKLLDYWFDMGVDGMRLDAIPYLFEREGTNCENLPETHGFLKQLRSHLDRRFTDKLLLAEANQWPEDACAYFGDGDECHMNFHFPVMPRLFMAVRMEDRFPIIDIMEQTPKIPENCQWAVFLRNHDELTLEMVTDEDRDYMYRSYAADPRARINLGIRRRLAPLLGNDRRRIELMNALLFSLPGTPVLYYGDEIGMGDNIYLGDRNGVRTPMQWSGDRNAGFSEANPQKLFLPVILDPEYHYEALNVEAQQANSHSLLWWTRRLIALRKQHRAFGRGSLEFLYPTNHKVLAFIRRLGDEQILVVANLSRYVQHVELDLRQHEGSVPRELFGHTPFPAIGELPYLLTLGPHGFYWFTLEQEAAAESARRSAGPPEVQHDGPLEELFAAAGRKKLAAAIPALLSSRRWFAGKARRVRQATVELVVPLGGGKLPAQLLVVLVEYVEGESEHYAIPLVHAAGEAAERIEHEKPDAVLVRLRDGSGGERGILYDALRNVAVRDRLLEAMEKKRSFRSDDGTVTALATPLLAETRRKGGDLGSRFLRAEQSNSSVRYGEGLMLKLFRKVATGLNPDLELGRFLTEETSFRHLPRVAGALELQRGREEPMTLAILQEFVHSEGDAWSHSLDSVDRFFERVQTMAGGGAPPTAPELAGHLLEVADREIGEGAEIIGLYPQSAELLGRRTAELHLALASSTEDPAFAAEAFTSLYQRSLYQSMRSLAGRTLHLLETGLGELGERERAMAVELLERRQELVDRFADLLSHKLEASRIRIHGDYHLGQVLFTGDDFIILDFEGEPARSLGERRLKRSPLRDVAGMLRSLHYAAHSGLEREIERGLFAEETPVLRGWADFWYRVAGGAFLRAYLQRLETDGAVVGGELPLIPTERRDLTLMLDAYLLEKAIYELAYELNNRPDWVSLPLVGILDLLGSNA